MTARSATYLAEDIDWVVVDRLVRGQPVEYTSFERREAVRILHQRGMPKNTIARHLGVNNRQVYKDLAWQPIPTRPLVSKTAVAALTAAGASAADTARLLNVSPSTILDVRRALGLTTSRAGRNTRRPTLDELRRVLEALPEPPIGTTRL